MKIFLVAGARPNFMKIAPVVHELKRRSRKKSQIIWRIIHTGQHYDYEMSRIFFKELDIPEPDYFLNAGSGSHAEQTAKVMSSFEKVCLKEKPDIVVVVGDVNSTLACAVTAKKLNIRVAHIEAGLRSRDMTMPEEINRIITDSIADYLFTTEKQANINLKKEGKDKNQIFFVGNIMIDTLFYGLRKLKGLKKKKIAKESNYAVATLHRPSNVDNKIKLKDILRAIRRISLDLPVYFPIHPRTRKNIALFNLKYIIASSNIKLLSPLSYLNFLNLYKDAKLVLTDSGGIQEETTVLGIPCFTIRENTERPITIKQGTNILVGTTGDKILKVYNRFKRGYVKRNRTPELWDGRTARRIVDILISNAQEGHFRAIKNCKW